MAPRIPSRGLGKLLGIERSSPRTPRVPSKARDQEDVQSFLSSIFRRANIGAGIYSKPRDVPLSVTGAALGLPLYTTIEAPPGEAEPLPPHRPFLDRLREFAGDTLNVAQVAATPDFMRNNQEANEQAKATIKDWHGAIFPTWDSHVESIQDRWDNITEGMSWLEKRLSQRTGEQAFITGGGRTAVGGEEAAQALDMVRDTLGMGVDTLKIAWGPIGQFFNALAVPFMAAEQANTLAHQMDLMDNPEKAVELVKWWLTGEEPDLDYIAEPDTPDEARDKFRALGFPLSLLPPLNLFAELLARGHTGEWSWKNDDEAEKYLRDISGLEDVRRLWDAGEIGYSMAADERQEVWELIKQGRTIEEFKASHHNVLQELYWRTVFDPLWLIPAAAWEKFVPIGKGITLGMRGLKKMPVISWLLRQSQHGKETARMDQMADLLGTTVGRRVEGRPPLDAVVDMIRGVPEGLAMVGPRQMETRRRLITALNSRAKELGMQGDLASARPHEIDRMIRDLISLAPEAGPIPARTSADLIIEHISRLYRPYLRETMGLAPYAFRTPGGLRFVRWTRKALKEMWLIPNPAFMLTNWATGVARVALTMGPAAAFRTIRYGPVLRRIGYFGRRAPVSKRWGYLAEEEVVAMLEKFGARSPRDLYRTWVSTIMGEGALAAGAAPSAAAGVAIPLVGRPGAIKRFIERRLGSDYSAAVGRGLKERHPGLYTLLDNATKHLTDDEMANLPYAQRLVAKTTRGLNVAGVMEGARAEFQDPVELALRMGVFESYVAPEFSLLHADRLPTYLRQAMTEKAYPAAFTDEVVAALVNSDATNPAEILRILDGFSHPTRISAAMTEGFIGPVPTTFSNEALAVMGEVRLWAADPGSGVEGLRRIVERGQEQVFDMYQLQVNHYIRQYPINMVWDRVHGLGLSRDMAQTLPTQIRAARAAAQVAERRAFRQAIARSIAAEEMGAVIDVEHLSSIIDEAEVGIATIQAEFTQRIDDGFVNFRVRYQEALAAGDEQLAGEIWTNWRVHEREAITAEFNAARNTWWDDNLAGLIDDHVARELADDPRWVSREQMQHILDERATIAEEQVNRDLNDIYNMRQTEQGYLDEVLERGSQAFETAKAPIPEQIARVSEETNRLRHLVAQDSGAIGLRVRRMNALEQTEAGRRLIPSIQQETATLRTRLEANRQALRAGNRELREMGGREAFEDVHVLSGGDRDEFISWIVNEHDDIMYSGTMMSNKVNFDYANTNEMMEIAKWIFPFPIWPMKSIPFWTRQIARKPVLGVTFKRFRDESEFWREQENLTRRFQGALPVPDAVYQLMPQALVERLTGEGYIAEKGGVLAFKPTALMDLFGQMPILTGDDLFGYEDESWFGRVVRAPQLVGFGTIWPWWEIPLTMLGGYQGVPASDLTNLTAFLKYTHRIDLDYIFTEHGEGFLENLNIAAVDSAGNRFSIRDQIRFYYAGLRLLHYQVMSMDEGTVTKLNPEWIEEYGFLDKLQQGFEASQTDPANWLPSDQAELAWLWMGQPEPGESPIDGQWRPAFRGYSDGAFVEEGELITLERFRVAKDNVWDPLFQQAMLESSRVQWARSIWRSIIPISFVASTSSERRAIELQELGRAKNFTDRELRREWLKTGEGQIYLARLNFWRDEDENLEEYHIRQLDGAWRDYEFAQRNEIDTQYTLEVDDLIRKDPANMVAVNEVIRIWNTDRLMPEDLEFPTGYSRAGTDKDLRRDMQQDALRVLMGDMPRRSEDRWYRADGSFREPDFRREFDSWMETILDGSNGNWGAAELQVWNEFAAGRPEQFRMTSRQPGMWANTLFNSEEEVLNLMRLQHTPTRAAWEMWQDHYIGQAYDEFGNAIDNEYKGARDVAVWAVRDRFRSGIDAEDMIGRILEEYGDRWSRKELRALLDNLTFPGFDAYRATEGNTQSDLIEVNQAYDRFHAARRTAGFDDKFWVFFNDEYNRDMVGDKDARKRARELYPIKDYEDWYKLYKERYPFFAEVRAGDHTPPNRFRETGLREEPQVFFGEVIQDMQDHDEKSVLHWLIQNPGDYWKLFAVWDSIPRVERDRFNQEFPGASVAMKDLMGWFKDRPSAEFYERIVNYAEARGIDTARILALIEDPDAKSATYDLLSDLESDRQLEEEYAQEVEARRAASEAEEGEETTRRTRGTGGGGNVDQQVDFIWETIITRAGMAVTEELARFFATGEMFSLEVLQRLKELHAELAPSLSFEMFLELLREKYSSGITPVGLRTRTSDRQRYYGGSRY